MEAEDDDDKLYREQQDFALRAATEIKKQRYETALQLYQEELRIMVTRLGEWSPKVLQLKVKMATILSQQTRPAGAERIHREVMAATYFLLVKSEMRSMDTSHIALATVSIRWLRDRAIAYFNDGKHDRAEQLFRDIFEVARAILGDINPLSSDIKQRLIINTSKLTPTLVTTGIKNVEASSAVPKQQSLQESKTEVFDIAQNHSPNDVLAIDDAKSTIETNPTALDIPSDNNGLLGFDDNQEFEMENKENTGKTSDNWFKVMLERHTQPLLTPYRDEAKRNQNKQYRRVRVAILDTGIDVKHPDVQKYSERIKDTHSWIPGEPGNMDDSGHGTHVTMLLLKVAPETDVYVARVFSTIHRNTNQSVSLAIRYAVEIWEVDIISMSFGSPVIGKDLSDAIGLAAYNNVLMFAAASNNGKNEIVPRAYPARDYRVFSIGSTDGFGCPSKFNPAAQEDDLNLCILGEAVMSATINGKTVRKSGTSMATPIAAGIAAILIEFARQVRVDGEDEVENADAIASYQGMRQLFKAMSDRDGSGHRYIIPWKILSQQATFSGQDQSNLLKARNEIAREISKLLRRR